RVFGGGFFGEGFLNLGGFLGEGFLGGFFGIFQKKNMIADQRSKNSGITSEGFFMSDLYG
ncbi:MAG: hypothetical protein JXR91_09280, partial [Deltaproteobacteria bacterium]|nr:hypothetical protein [Deltaproteobacteria bacterium]